MLRVFVVFLIFLSSSIFSQVQEQEKLVFAIKDPQFYEDSIFALSPSENLSKLTLSGSQVWELDPALEVDSFIVHFKKLYVLDRQGKLYKYNAGFSFKEWVVEAYEIKSFKLSYPFIFLNTKDQLVCIDAKSGDSLWKKYKTFIEVSRIGRTGLIAAVKNKELVLINILTGEEEKKHRLPQSDLSYLGSTNSQVFLYRDNVIYEFDLSKNEFSVIPFQAGMIKNYLFANYYYVYNEKSIQLFSMGLNQALWTINCSDLIEQILFYKEYFVVQLSESMYQVYDSLTGKELSPEFKFDQKDDVTFYPFGSSVFALTGQEIVNIKRVK